MVGHGRPPTIFPAAISQAVAGRARRAQDREAPVRRRCCDRSFGSRRSTRSASTPSASAGTGASGDRIRRRLGQASQMPHRAVDAQLSAAFGRPSFASWPIGLPRSSLQTTRRRYRRRPGTPRPGARPERATAASAPAAAAPAIVAAENSAPVFARWYWLRSIVGSHSHACPAAIPLGMPVAPARICTSAGRRPVRRSRPRRSSGTPARSAHRRPAPPAARHRRGAPTASRGAYRHCRNRAGRHAPARRSA